MAGLSLRLDAVVAREMDDKGRKMLLASRGIVSQIQVETRSMLSDLRTSGGESENLAAALASLAERHPGECGPRLELQVASDLPLFPSRTVHHLRMISQEAVTNALKHARPSRIALRLERDGDCLLLTISDDGVGFDTAESFHRKSGHFGCVGIVERAEKIGAEVAWHSTPGKGTSVEVALPVSKACVGGTRDGAQDLQG